MGYKKSEREPETELMRKKKESVRENEEDKEKIWKKIAKERDLEKTRCREKNKEDNYTGTAHKRWLLIDQLSSQKR